MSATKPQTFHEMLKLISPLLRLTVLTTTGEVTGVLCATMDNDVSGPVLLAVNDETRGGQTVLVPWHSITRIFNATA